MNQSPLCDEPCVPIKILIGFAIARRDVDPNAEASAITDGLRQAFVKIPGFTEAKGECVTVDNVSWDLICGFKSGQAEWQPYPVALDRP